MATPKSFKSWKVVTLSFVGATTFWFFSALGKEYSYRINHPIEFLFDTDSLIAVKPLPKYVDLDVSGGGWDLFKESFWFGSDPVSIELENPAAIRFLTRPTILPILTEELSQYRVNFLFTDTLFIDINRKSTKQLQLTIDSTRIELENNFRIISPISIEPDTLTLFGPTSFLDTLSSSFVLTLDDDDIDEDYFGEANLRLPSGYEIFSEPSTVNVSFEVDRFNTFQLQSTVELMNFPEDSSVYLADPSISIQFVVQESKEVDFLSTDFKVIVDYDMRIKSDSTAPAIVIVQPEQAIEIEVIPDTLALTYGN